MGAADRVSLERLTDDLRRVPDPACAVEALALAGYFNPEVVPLMAHLVEKKDWRTQSRAVSVLLHLGGRAKAALPALLRAQREDIPGSENAIRRIHQAQMHEKRRR